MTFLLNAPLPNFGWASEDSLFRPSPPSLSPSPSFLRRGREREREKKKAQDRLHPWDRAPQGRYRESLTVLEKELTPSNTMTKPTHTLTPRALFGVTLSEGWVLLPAE
jgi:hypothetical protein